MKADCWHSSVIVVVLASMLCICSVGVVAMDEGADAAEVDEGAHGDDSVSGSGTSDDPIILPSSYLVSNIADFVYIYFDDIVANSELYFSFDSDSTVDFSTSYNYVMTVLDAGSLTHELDGSLSGVANCDFAIQVSFYHSSIQYVCDLKFLAIDSVSVDFTSPDAVEAVSGSTISYTAVTNIPATFSEVGGSAASWLEIDSTTGQITGVFPEVDEETIFTYEIQATSIENPSSTATMTITITVTPALRFFSEPDDPLYASITYNRT